MVFSKQFNRQFIHKVAVILIGVAAYSNMFSAEVKDKIIEGPTPTRMVKIKAGPDYDGYQLTIYFQDADGRDVIEPVLFGKLIARSTDETRDLPIQYIQIRVISAITREELFREYFSPDKIASIDTIDIGQNGNLFVRYKTYEQVENSSICRITQKCASKYCRIP